MSIGIVMGGIALVLLLLGCPFFVVLISSFLAVCFSFFPNLNLGVLVQQVLTGVSPIALVCIPMFMLAANIIVSGQSAERLINLVRVFLGHLRGGIPIITNVACTLFGSVSGSTQATVAAIGGVMRPMLLKAGYSDSFALGLIINSSDIAFLIPPSIGFILYGVVTQTSVGKLFLAGIIPGILVCLSFSIFCYFYSRYKKIPTLPKSTWKEKVSAVKESIWLVGFPVIILGGIYGGIFSPTEAAAVSVFYAIFLEGIVYKSLTLKKLKDALLLTAIVTAVVFIITGAGQALSWILGYSGISKKVFPALFGPNPSYWRIILIINISYFIACMFVDPIVAIYVFSPIFAPYIEQAGISKILIGVLVTMQVAIGSATPPCGCDIFTAMTIFKRPYLETIRLTWPFVIILLFVTALVAIFPELALFLTR